MRSLLRRCARLSPTQRGVTCALLGALTVLVVAVGVSAYQRGLIDDSAREALEVRADSIEASAATEVARYLGVAEVVAAGLGAFDGVTEDKFRTITAGVDEMGLNGATSIVYISPPVATEDVAAAEARWRRTFAPDLELDVTESTGDHVFALASVSLDGEPNRPGGTDVSAAAAPFAALMEARRTGSPAVSDAYELLIDQELPEAERQTSFSLVVPIEHDDEFLGWVLIGLRGQDFLGHVLDVAGEGSVGTLLEAGDETGAVLPVAAVEAPGRSATIMTARTLDVAQQEWTLQLSADFDALVGQSRVMPRNALLAGGVLAALAAVLIWLLVTGRERSRVLVGRATADLAAAEAVSRRQASLLDAMLDTIDDVGVSLVDADGHFLLQSRAAREILGAEEERSAGGEGPVATPDNPQVWQENFGVFHLDGTPMDSDEMPLVRALGGHRTDGFPMLIRNSNRPEGVQIEVSGRPLPLGDGRPGALAVFRDVTLERLQQAELTGFAGVVAHDLRHPLTIISGYVGMLTDHCLPELEGDPAVLAETAAYLAKATAGTARMAELISDLLDYTTARDADLTWQEVDLDALAREVVSFHLDQASATGAPVPHLHVAPLPRVEGDPDRLRQLFDNLMGNAVKYVVPGTVPLLDVTASRHRGRLRLRFADRGIGIAPDRVGDVFRPFVRAHTGTPEGLAYTGTGLGLAICHQVVQRHGGEITVQANPGGGSVFIVDLPLVATSDAVAHEEPGCAPTHARLQPVTTHV